MKLYQYTIYKQDGRIIELNPCPKKSFAGTGGLYELLDCRIIELLPKAYLHTGMNHRATYYCDEEGRFNSNNHRNRLFKVLDGGFDVVGDVVKEQVYAGAA